MTMQKAASVVFSVSVDLMKLSFFDDETGYAFATAALFCVYKWCVMIGKYQA